DDRQKVVGSAHRIEGAARMLGAMPYARAAERVKRLFGLDQDVNERAEAVALLQTEGERLRTWLHTTRDWFEPVTVGAGTYRRAPRGPSSARAPVSRVVAPGHSCTRRAVKKWCDGADTREGRRAPPADGANRPWDSLLHHSQEHQMFKSLSLRSRIL